VEPKGEEPEGEESEREGEDLEGGGEAEGDRCGRRPSPPLSSVFGFKL
jgi:hypothetical protein